MANFISHFSKQNISCALAHFIAKLFHFYYLLRILTYETEYWLELLFKTNSITEEKYKKYKKDCGTIRRILIKSINTAKGN